MNRKILLSCILLASCAGNPQDASDESDPDSLKPSRAEEAPPGLTYYRDVKPIIDSKCTQCHVDGGMGPFPLINFEQVSGLKGAIRGSVNAGRMPPWRAEGPLDKYIGDRRLSDEQKIKLLGWIEQGAPAGDPADEPPKQEPEKRGLSRVDWSITMPEAYEPEDNGDDYRCFPLPLPNTEKAYITGLGMVPSNPSMVHHAVLYLVSPSQAATVKRQDANDPGPGFECFGGSVGTWVSSYEPGGYGQDNPEGIGYAVEPGSYMVMQMHYNSEHGHRAPDQTTLEVKVDSQVQRIGRVPQLMDYRWVGGGMRIPANNPDKAFNWSGRSSSLTTGKSYDVFTADLHMHLLGKSGSIYILRSNGERETLLHIPDWSFHWQETFRLRQPARLGPNDKLGIECHFDNTQAKQPDRAVKDVYWGERTTDEMCFGNVIAAEALPEEPKPEEPKPEEPKPEEPKPEEPKPEEPKPEEPKPEEPKPEEPKPEEPKPEQPKPEQPKPEQPKPSLPWWWEWLFPSRPTQPTNDGGIRTVR